MGERIVKVYKRLDFGSNGVRGTAPDRLGFTTTGGFSAPAAPFIVPLFWLRASACGIRILQMIFFVASMDMVSPVSRSSIWVAMAFSLLLIGGGIYLALWRWRSADSSAPPTARFCRQCGAELAVPNKFCPGCGTPLAIGS